MASEKQKLNSNMTDKRTVGRYMEKGMMSKTEYESYLKSLPDDAQNADWVQMDMDEPEMTGDSDVSDSDQRSNGT